MNANAAEAIRRVMTSFPGVVESRSYGTPSFKLGKKLIARFHEDGTTLVLKMDIGTRDFLLQASPETYFITEHYRNYPYVLVRMDQIDMEELKGHVYEFWKANATKKQLKENRPEG